MDKIQKHVAHARRLLWLQTWGNVLTWPLVLVFATCFVALLVPKIWYLPYTFESWAKVWLIGGSAIALLWTFVAAWIQRPTFRQSALEIDKRFELRERVSSAIDLDESQRSTPFGEALLSDAISKLDRVDVRDQFPLRLSAILPWVLVPVLGCIALFWVPDAESPGETELVESQKVRLQNVKLQTKPVLDQVKKIRTDLEEKGLLETSEQFKNLERKLDEIQNAKNLDPKKLLSDFNEIKKEMENRKESLGSQDSMKKAMEGLKDMEKGPGDKFAEALKQGDMQQAQKETEKLLEKLKAGKLSDKEKGELADQLTKMQKALDEAQRQQQQALEQLKNELEKAQQSGDLSKAGQLQKQIDAMESAMSKSSKSGQLGQKIAKAAAAMQKGDSQEAEAALQELSQQLEEMGADSETLEELDNLMNELQNAKQASNCKACSGAGCKACNGSGKSGKKSNSASKNRTNAASQGPGKGHGSGAGDPEDELQTKEFDAQVRDQVRKGEKILGGKVAGPNRAGMSLEEVRQSVQNAAPEDPDAVENIAIPKAQREQLREYFEQLRKQ